MFLSLESPPPLLRVHAALSPVGQFGITLYLLYWQIGVSFLSGLVFAIALVPLNKWIANKTGAWGGGHLCRLFRRAVTVTGMRRGVG